MPPPAPAERRGFSLGWAILAVAVIALLLRTVDVLLLLLVAVIIAVYLDAVARAFARFGLPRDGGIAAAAVLSLGILATVGVVIAPPLVEQVQGLAANLPQYLADLDRNIAALIARVPLLRHGPIPTSSSLISSTFTQIMSFVRGAALPYLKGGFEALVDVVSVAVMSVYLVRHPGIYAGGVVALVPPRRRRLAGAILHDLGTAFRAWVIGQIADMFILGALTTIGLWALGVPYFLAFGTFAGVAAIVPFFGVLFSTLLPALFALGTLGFVKALLVAALGVGVHLVEANFVAPVVMERQVNVPPVLTILGVLLVGKLFGLVGLIVSVPILVLAMVLVRHILLGEIYGDPVSELKPSGTVPDEHARTVGTPHSTT
jgi:predicted PurR-regulated permease PerM